jgi:hypothetical protein
MITEVVRVAAVKARVPGGDEVWGEMSERATQDHKRTDDGLRWRDSSIAT